jgi:hypothetical protein
MQTPAILSWSTNDHLSVLHMVSYFPVVCLGVVAITSLWNIALVSAILCIAFGTYNGFPGHQTRFIRQQTIVLVILLLLRLGWGAYYDLKDGTENQDNSREMLKNIAEDILAWKFLPKSYMMEIVELYLGGGRHANGGYAAAMARCNATRLIIQRGQFTNRSSCTDCCGCK